MKKFACVAAVAALLSASAFAELKVSGFIRGGINGDCEDGYVNDPSVKGNAWVGGYYFGGNQRLRLNFDYEAENGGISARFQNDDFSNWFEESNKKVKWAMGYAKFFDGKIIAEGGKLHDAYTSTGGDLDYSFSATAETAYGVRLVVNPIEGLYVTASATNLNPDTYDYSEVDQANSAKKARRQGKIKPNHTLGAVSAKYGNDTFFVVGGFHGQGLSYAGVGFTGIENLTLIAEGKMDLTYHGQNHKAHQYGIIVGNLEYAPNDNITLGCISYSYIARKHQFFADGGTKEEDASGYQHMIVPYVSFKVTELLELRGESSFYIADRWDEDDYGTRLRNYFTVTPSVVLNASKKANVTAWATIYSRDDKLNYSKTDLGHTSAGVGVCYKF